LVRYFSEGETNKLFEGELKMKKVISGLLLGITTLGLGIAISDIKGSATKFSNVIYISPATQRKNDLKTAGWDETFNDVNPHDGPVDVKISNFKAKRTKSGKHIKLMGSIKFYTKKIKKSFLKKHKNYYVWLTSYKGDKYVKLSNKQTFKTTIKAPKAKVVIATLGYYSSKKKKPASFHVETSTKRAVVTSYKK